MHLSIVNSFFFESLALEAKLKITGDCFRLASARAFGNARRSIEFRIVPVANRALLRAAPARGERKGATNTEGAEIKPGDRKSRPASSTEIQTSEKLSREMGYFIDRRKRKVRGRERGWKGERNGGDAGVTGRARASADKRGGGGRRRRDGKRSACRVLFSGVGKAGERQARTAARDAEYVK